MFSEISSSGSRRTPSASNTAMGLREFLSSFKTTECSRGLECPDPWYCEHFHEVADMRRRPFHKNCLQYSPELCQDPQCQLYPVSLLVMQNCSRCHSQLELDFHPQNYLTAKCQRYYNCYRKFCPFYHEKQLELVGSNYFRFDLATFKTKSCCYEYMHDLKTCLYYHNAKDRRRPHLNYYHVMCESRGECPSGDACYYAHNKIEQLYHPSRYKSKFCEKYPEQLAECYYREFCSFAHSKSYIAIELIHEKAQNTEFMINLYKTVWCPYTNEHDRKKCVYAHNVQDFRRAPNLYNYYPERCPSWNTEKTLKSPEMGGCSKGMSCNKCHGWKEYDYHPRNYTSKTRQRKNISRNNPVYDTPNCRKYELMRKLHEKGSNNLRNNPKIYPVIVSSTILVGAPFFQHYHERDLSVTDKVSKPYFKISSSSDVEAHDKNKGKRKESLDSFDSKHERKCYEANNFLWKVMSSLTKIYGGAEEKYMFSYFNDSHESEYQPTFKERARSCSKHSKPYDLTYSKSFEDLFTGTCIVEKLKNQRLSEIKVVNMTSEDVQEQLKSLNETERALLLEKLHEYNARSYHSMVSYSNELMEVHSLTMKFFRRNNRQHILEKMRKKRVKYDKLLSLIENEIQSLSFIEEEDKLLLPGLLRDFTNNKYFSDINRSISLKVSNSTSEVDEREPIAN